ncbi:MAG TPA: SDR family oxidoreductase [Ilumatobacteraceae bacterium]|jgi:NAD(P)-dependent dehydrogenase (short-subunit alcohol dehydrogenase family)
MELDGRHVVVTGAANGIGRALARRFHAEGASVVASDRDAEALASVVEQLERDRPGSAVAVTADVGTEAGNRDLVAAAEDAFGAIDLFFANAGVAVGTDLTTPESEWDLAFNVNVHAHRWAAKYLLPGWLARGEGYFCATASAAGLLSQIGSAPYSLTKHAAVAFAEWISITYGDRGVRVSCLCPQGVNTNMLNGGPTTSAGAGDVVRASGVVLEPEDVAEVAVGVIRAETFLILPHPEVLTYLQRKTGDHDRWLAGMRKLQARIVGG